MVAKIVLGRSHRNRSSAAGRCGHCTGIGTMSKYDRPGKPCHSRSLPGADLWICNTYASQSNITAMANKEMLHASLLDILFEGRNKEYGAYALRRGYGHRLLTALGAGLSVILLFMLVSTLMNSGDNRYAAGNHYAKDNLVLTQIELRPDPQPEQPKPEPVPPKPVRPAASVKYTTPLLVDNLPRAEAPDMTTPGNNAIGTDNKPGEIPAGIAPAVPPVADGGTGPATGMPASGHTGGSYSSPEFPGGFEALREFLSRNLVTPHDLDAGEKKMVRARFFVDKDGFVSGVEIETSGGKAFDREVIRVCKKMPKWKPAIQNGNPVKVSYVLPVTFVGAEQ